MAVSRKVGVFVVLTAASCGGVLVSPSGVDGGPGDDPSPDPSKAGAGGSVGSGGRSTSSMTVSATTGNGGSPGYGGYAGGYGGTSGYGGSPRASGGSTGTGKAGYGGYSGTGYAGGGYGGTGYGGTGYAGGGYAGGKSGYGGYGGYGGYTGGYAGGKAGYAGQGYAGSAGSGGSGIDGSAPRCYGKVAYPETVTFPVISKFDGDAGTTIEAVTPGGVWLPDSDGLGTLSMKVEPCGTTGSGLHFVGSGHVAWGADIAAAFVGPIQAVDASRYSGISFVIKAQTPLAVFVKLQNLDSSPSCGRCNDAVPGSECYAGYMNTVAATNGGTPFSLRWSDFVATTWGYHWPGQRSIDPKELVSIAFAIDKNVDFDICIDDIVFTF
jgi:hypothetical protein